MPIDLLPTKKELADAFETAKIGFDQETIECVMKGIPVVGGDTPEIMQLKIAWSRYHSYMH
jgi:hypothetical protein